MTSYISLLSKIEAFCNAHLQIKKYGGEFREQMPNFATKDEKYPVVFVTPTSDTEALNTNQFTVDIYCVDLIQADRANLNSIISDCQLILKDMYVYYTNDNDIEIDVVGTASMTPLNNQDLDYVAGWVMSITFEVASYGDCAIPMNPINPNPPIVCEDATQIITDSNGNELYSNSIPSGATETQVIQDSAYTVEYINGTLIESGSVLAEGSVTVQVPNPIVCADATVNVNGAFWDTVPSGGTENVIVRQSSGSTQVGSIQGQYFRIADSTAVLKDTSGTTISTTSIKAEDTEDIVAPNTTLEVNGTTEGTVVSGSTVDIQLSDSGGVVTPTSVTQVGNDFQVVLPDAVAAAPRSTATLMKTGQTTSYRTGDDGDIEAGRDTDFFTLDAAPLHNNGAATINTTTNRFTDELGGQTYANDIVLDWSTWNGSTLLGYSRVNIATGNTWQQAIDNSLTYSLGTFTTNWRLSNIKEIFNIVNYQNTTGTLLNYAPLNLSSVGRIYWSSTTIVGATTFAYVLNNVGQTSQQSKTSSVAFTYIPVRTFSLSTSNVLS